MNLKSEVTVALVGKYIKLHDAYLSVASTDTRWNWQSRQGANQWIDSETISPENVAEILKDVHGILVPGGFGQRVGWKGRSRRSALHVNKGFLFGDLSGNAVGGSGICTPCSGICRCQFCGIRPTDRTSGDRFNARTKDIISWGTMRLGKYPCKLEEGSKAAFLYGNLLLRSAIATALR